MAASTQIITDLTTVKTAGFSATTQANASAPAGVIMDLNGNMGLLILKAKEMKNLLNEILKDVDAGDPQLATLQNVLLTLS